MTEDASPENLRKFLESDDPAMVMMGLSMAKGSGVEVTVKDLGRLLKSEKVRERGWGRFKVNFDIFKAAFTFAKEKGIGKEAIELAFGMDQMPENEYMGNYDFECEGKAGTHWIPIIEALGEIGDVLAVEPLIKLHDYEQQFPTDEDVFAGEVHDAVLVALGKIGETDKTPWALVETFWAGYSTHLEGDDDMIYHGCREAAREALEKIGEPAIDSVAAVFDYYGGEHFEHAVPQECTRWDILEDSISLLRKLAGDNRTAEILLKVIEKEISQETKLKDNVHEHDDPWYGCSLCGSIEAKVCAAIGLVNMKHDKASEKLLEVYELALSLQPDDLDDDYCNWDAVLVRPVELLGEQSVEPLIKAFEEGNLFVAEALGKSGGSAVEPLIKALGNSDCDIRVNAIDALGDIGDVRAVEPLVTTLKDEEDRVRYRSASALGKIGDARAVQPLIKALGNEGRDVRYYAAALGSIGDARAVESLIEMLGDNRSAVRISSAQALDKLGWVPETDELRGIYLVAKNDWHAITEMGHLAVEPLFKALGDVDDSVRRDGVITLGNIGDARAVEPLIKVLEDIKYLKINTATIGQVWVRRHAVNALGKIGDARAIEPLSQALEDDDWEIRCNVAKALGEISDVRAVEHLIGALRDDNRYVRKSAAEALGKIGNERAVEPLIGVLEDEYVHDDAKEALKKLGHVVE